MIQQTVEEQQRYLYWHRRNQQRLTPRRLLRESDLLMYWLEECIEREMRIVPGWLMPRLVSLLREAGSELAGDLGRERRPAQVMDILFRAQEALMEEAISARRPAEVVPLFR